MEGTSSYDVGNISQEKGASGFLGGFALAASQLAELVGRTGRRRHSRGVEAL